MKRSYPAIKDQLIEDIRGHVYLPGQFMPSENQLATRFGVSRPTVRRALGDLQRENMVERKPGVGTVVLGTQVRPGSKPVRTLAVNMAKGAVGPLGDSIRLQIMNGILAAFHEHGIRMLFAPGEDILQGQFEDLDGVIWIKDGGASYGFAQTLAAKRIPVVMANRLFDRLDWNCVSADHRQGMFQGVEYLIGLGHRRIALIGGTEDAWLYETRSRGYVDAFRAYDIPVDPALILADQHEASTVDKVRAFLSDRQVSAVVTLGSNATPAVVQAATSLYRVPDQMSLVCFDDTSAWLAGGLPLTCVRQPLVEMGKTAVELMLDYARGIRNQRRLLPCELVVRQSCCRWNP